MILAVWFTLILVVSLFGTDSFSFNGKSSLRLYPKYERQVEPFHFRARVTCWVEKTYTIKQPKVPKGFWDSHASEEWSVHPDEWKEQVCVRQSITTAIGCVIIN
jgi:hypothetical protein